MIIMNYDDMINLYLNYKNGDISLEEYNSAIKKYKFKV